MSWDRFRESVLKVMNSSPSSTDIIAEKIAYSYDLEMKKPPAGDLLNRNFVVKANLDEFTEHIKNVYNKQSKSLIQLPIVNLIATGFPKYWRNAQLTILFPPKPTPTYAPTTVISNNVVFPGSPVTKPYPVTKSQTPEKIVNEIIDAAKIHLATITGQIKFNCVYPTVPTPSPGILVLPWFGYNVKESDSDESNTENIDWNIIFNEGKTKLFNSLENSNIDADVVAQYAKPLILTLNNLGPKLISDSNKGDTISSSTKNYIILTILPSLLNSIDEYWKTLGVFKKNSFKLLTKGNEKKIIGSINSLLTSFVYGLLAGCDKANVKNEKLRYVINDLQTQMGGSDSLFGLSALRKINSLS